MNRVEKMRRAQANKIDPVKQEEAARALNKAIADAEEEDGFPSTVRQAVPNKPAKAKLLYTCGHEAEAIPCGRCRNKAAQERAERRRAKHPPKQPEPIRPRLPIGYAGNEYWVGTITVPGIGPLDGEASSVRKLWRVLDDLYREELRKREAADR